MEWLRPTENAVTKGAPEDEISKRSLRLTVESLIFQ